MRKGKKNKVSISGKRIFILYCVAMIIILVISLIVSIIDHKKHLINWPIGYENIIGVMLQIIVTVITMIVSIIGISISLQNEKVFGCKLTILYALRKRNHYSVLQIIIISISLCILNAAFFMLELTIAVIGTSITSLLFVFQVVILEIPIMVKTESAVKCILKDNFIKCYLYESEIPKPVKDAVRYLLYNDNLKNTFEFLKDDSDQEYSQYTLIKLLEFQYDLAIDLNTQYDDREQLVIGSSLLENVFDVLLRHITVSDSVYSKVIENKYLLIQVLFQIRKLPEVQNRFSEKIESLILLLSYPKKTTLDFDLLSDVIIILSAWTIEEGDTIVINALRLQLSNYNYILKKSSYALDVFALISMYFYYLSCSDPDVPHEIKQMIKDWIGEGNIIERGTKITSWKKLFYQTANVFQVNYDRLTALVTRNADTLEYYLHGNGAKWVILEQSYVARWYLTNWLNTSVINNRDFSALIKQFPNLKNDLKSFGNQCLNEDHTFVPTEEMNQIVEFYSDNANHFIRFKIIEQVNHNFFKFINDLNYAELKSNADAAANLNQNDLAQKITSEIRTVLQNEWGFDSHQTIDNTDRYFSVLFEKMPEAINFEEIIIDYCVDSVLAELENATKKTVVYNSNQFDNNIQSIISKNPKYVSQSVKDTIPCFIESEEIKHEFIDACDNCDELHSKILGDMVIVLSDKDFRFNCEVLEVGFQELSEKELVDEVEKHQREDGQFVFNGVFMPREKIIEIVKAKYTVLTIRIKYQVVSSKENIFELVPYANN